VPAQRKKAWVHRCPRCHARTVQQAVRKGVLERMFLALVRQRAYLCRKCGRRFYDVRS
jgi:DNA-directed RNA polymerase subunit RPC12/RpoP